MRMGSSWRWQLTRAMGLSLRWCRLCCPQRASKGGAFVKLWSYCKLLLKSLYFNSLSNSDTLLDCVFEPVYWIVDNVTRWFGVVSDRCLSSLTSCSLSSSSALHSSFSCRCSSLWSYCSRPRLWSSSTCSSYLWSSAIILGTGSSGTSAVATGFSPWWSSIIIRPPPPPQDAQPRYPIRFFLQCPCLSVSLKMMPVMPLSRTLTFITIIKK